MTNIVAILERELGKDQIIGPGHERLNDYARDESPFPVHYVPDCAALCATTEQVAAVLRICAEQQVPVTPRGAGSGMCGGALPIAGGVVLSTETMRKIVEVNTDDLVAVVEPGVITGELAAAEAAGMFYPPDPASLASCSIGGNAATNAGGLRAFKYGVTREYMLGLQVALMGGETMRIGRRTAKGVTGYDLVANFVGSEGTFGVITELTVKLLPKPPAATTVLAVFADVVVAGAAITELLRQGVRPAILEIADRASIGYVRGKSRYRFPENAGGVVLIELDGDDETVVRQMEQIGMRCDELGAIDVLVASDPKERAALWEARRLISPSLKANFKIKVNEDICVPRGKIVEMLKRIDQVASQTKLDTAVFGHAGDGNLHVNLLSNQDPNDPAVKAYMMDAARMIFAHTIELGGTLSGEHGIGLSKRDFLPMEQTAQVMAWQRKLKRLWDPAELLNPGKVLPPQTKRCNE